MCHPGHPGRCRGASGRGPMEPVATPRGRLLRLYRRPLLREEASGQHARTSGVPRACWCPPPYSFRESCVCGRLNPGLDRTCPRKKHEEETGLLAKHADFQQQIGREPTNQGFAFFNPPSNFFSFGDSPASTNTGREFFSRVRGFRKVLVKKQKK